MHSVVNKKSLNFKCKYVIYFIKKLGSGSKLSLDWIPPIAKQSK